MEQIAIDMPAPRRAASPLLSVIDAFRSESGGQETSFIAPLFAEFRLRPLSGVQDPSLEVRSPTTESTSTFGRGSSLETAPSYQGPAKRLGERRIGVGRPLHRDRRFEGRRILEPEIEVVANRRATSDRRSVQRRIEKRRQTVDRRRTATLFSSSEAGSPS